MAIPHKLAAEITIAVNLISADGELPAMCRKKLLQLTEELSLGEHADAGYLRRARLALICAACVVGCIRKYPEVFAEAESLLANGAAALFGKYDMALLQKENGVFHTKVIDLFEHGEAAFVSAYAGMACFSAINTVLYDTNFDLVGEYEKTIPPDDWDAGYYASLARSGSAIWEAKGGKESRREYWLWYLKDAIPRAWDVLKPMA